MLKSALRRRAQRRILSYASASRSCPLTVAFVTCWLKGTVSDLVTQTLVEGKDRVDLKRNFAFAAFSGAYLGCGQHYVFNVVMTHLFGEGCDWKTALKKTAAEVFCHEPLVVLPLYYVFEDTVLGGGVIHGLKRYSTEWLDCMKPYVSIWTFFHLFNFSITPPELRIGLVACVSFVWLIILSYVSHQAYEAKG